LRSFHRRAFRLAAGRIAGEQKEYGTWVFRTRIFSLTAFIQLSCPLLPPVQELAVRVEGEVHSPVKDARFYEASLCQAQRRWREGKPAQAILQLNKAFMADLGEDGEILKSWPPPYGVLVWMLRNRPEGAFVGNPVRHFQHLATRVSGERKEIRSWRAWACFHLSRRVLPAEAFPVDGEQIEKERLEIPGWEAVLGEIRWGGWNGEAEMLRAVAAGQ
jgi:hypothetical protein